jgi:serine/threonine protein kinase
MRRTVSIQVPGDEGPADESPRRQTSQIALQRGGESLGRLNHPNIRNIIATEEADGTLYLVMEHVTAQPISEPLANSGMAPTEALTLLKMAGSALDHAHAHGVIHPGLTPRHLLVDKGGLLKVAGFEMSGLQEVPEEQMLRTDVELLLSSIPYRAPEFLTGEMNDSRADQFSLALIAFELLTGRRGYHQDSPLEAMAAIISAALPDFRLLESRIPASARRVFERALSGDPAVRYSSCSDMLEALEAATFGKSASATKATPAPIAIGSRTAGTVQPGTGSARLSEELAHARRKSSRRLQLVLVAACVAVVAIALMIVLEYKPAVRPNPVVEMSPAQPSPAAADSGASKQQIADTANKILEQKTPAEQVSASGKTGRVSQAKKPKRQKAAPDLDMGDVQVGR